MPNSPSPQSVIFVHLPRTGGTTLQYAIMNKIYTPEEIFITQGPASGGRINDSVESLENMPREQQRQFKAMWGHMSFGMHEFLDQPFTYITLIRHPVELTISAYHAIKSDPNHPHHQSVMSKHPSFEEYVRNQTSLNKQMRSLYGERGRNVNPPATEETYQITLENLIKYYSVIGITDRFDDSVKLLTKVLDWPEIPYQNLRTNRENRPKIVEISPELRQEIEEKCSYDLRLFNFAKKTFEAHFATHFGGIVEPGYSNQTDIDQANSLVDQAINALKVDNYVEASQYITEALKLEVRIRDLELVRAICFSKEQKIIEAREALKREIHFYPENQLAQDLFASGDIA